MIFDFLKKLFGWADETPRKRRAVSFSAENDFVTPKKHRFDYNTSNVEKDVFEIDEDSDSDEVELIDEQKYCPIGSSTKLNGSCRDRDMSYKFRSAQQMPSSSKQSSVCHPKSDMGYCTNKTSRMENMEADFIYPTLAKTHRLRERNQYEELLQNFLPRRIHIIRDKGEDQRAAQLPIEVIDLDKSSTLTPSPKLQVLSKKYSTPSHSRWSIPIQTKKDKETITLDGDKKDETIHSSYDKSGAAKSEPRFENAAQTKHIECIPTNTLRDKLAAKAVMREDFVPQVAKRYNERIEQRYKEVEELKKMTCVLSKHNRLAREAALEEQLARSMRLCEAVLDEREKPEEPSLPTLSEAMIKEIKNALIPRPPDEVLVEGYGLRITRKDMHTLSDLNWLNDEVINFYMNLLIARSNGDKFPRVHAMNTFFYPKFLSGGHASLKRWTRKVDIFAQDLIVVPIHLGIHWCMSIIDFRDKTIRYFDSMGSANPKCLSALRQYLEDESLDKKKQPFNTSDWKLESVKDIPRQMNGSDCGVFSCMFAEYICANRKITFTQQDMPYFRNKMVYEILKSKLL